ncbi:MAG: hypothetical protein NT068_02465 [Candidatus Nomurabacteria bacterium]|nr:hypothetical protein [Candidatus Nomurabacteria bacterium]
MANKTTEFLISHNIEESIKHRSPERKHARMLYKELHPARILLFKCMDGRVHIAKFTNIPTGILRPYRTLGGIFDLGDSYLSDLIEKTIKHCSSKKPCLIVSTYHFSKGSEKRCCAGHDNNTGQALVWAKRLRDQFKSVFLEKRNEGILYSIVMGIETDNQSLIFHNKNGEIFNVFENLNSSREEIILKMLKIFPDVSDEVMNALMELVMGNYNYIKNSTSEEVALDREHKELSLCIGLGFDWLHIPNKALIVSPFRSHLKTLDDCIAIAASIILKNIKSGRVDEKDGVTIMCAGLLFKEHTNDEAQKMRAHFLYKTAKKVIEKRVPELLNYNLEYVVGVTSHDTRLFTEFDPTEFEKTFEQGTIVYPEELTFISKISEN